MCPRTNKKCFFLIVIISLFAFQDLFSQNTENLFQNFKEDTLILKSFDDLYKFYALTNRNDSLYKLYSMAVLRKAYKKNDTHNIAKGYFILTRKNEPFYNFFIDSLLKYSSLINNKEWMYDGFFRKGVIANKNRNYQSAFENHNKAYHLSKLLNDPRLKERSIVSLGLIKERIGKNKKALDDFKKSYAITNSFIKDKTFDYITSANGISHLHTLHLLSNSYRLNKKLDSANLINIEAQKFKKFKWAKPLLNKIRLNSAEVHYDLKEYKSAIDSINISIAAFIKTEDYKSVAVSYYILGMSKFKLKLYKSGIADLSRMDSIYNELGNIYPAVRPGYETLIQYHKNQKNTSQQLYFVQQLLRFDSIAHQNYAYVYEGIVNKIEKPALIDQQIKLKKELYDTQFKFKWWTYLAILGTIILFLEILRRGRLLYKKEKEKEELEQNFRQKIDEILKNRQFKTDIQDRKLITEKENDIGISPEVIQQIKEALKKFEENKGFIKTELTATSLAKSMNTNANYLGRIVKHHYNKSFRNYINDLRIDYALQKLKKDKSFRKYSVQAMAKEVGFKNAEPFSKAFKERTGLYPSDFLKKLKA